MNPFFILSGRDLEPARRKHHDARGQLDLRLNGHLADRHTLASSPYMAIRHIRGRIHHLLPHLLPRRWHQRLPQALHLLGTRLEIAAFHVNSRCVMRSARGYSVAVSVLCGAGEVVLA